jgi:hypothetical protein
MQGVVYGHIEIARLPMEMKNVFYSQDVLKIIMDELFGINQQLIDEHRYPELAAVMKFNPHDQRGGRWPELHREMFVKCFNYAIETKNFDIAQQMILNAEQKVLEWLFQDNSTEKMEIIKTFEVDPRIGDNPREYLLDILRRAIDDEDVAKFTSTLERLSPPFPLEVINQQMNSQPHSSSFTTFVSELRYYV